MKLLDIVRSIVSVELMNLAVKIAPEKEKTSANLAVFEHLTRTLTSK